MNQNIRGDNQFSSKQDNFQASGDGRKNVQYKEKEFQGKKKSEQNFSSKKNAQKTQQQQQNGFTSGQPPQKDDKAKKKSGIKQICGMSFKCGHLCVSITHKIEKPHNKDCDNCKQQNQNQQNQNQQKKNCDHIFQCGHGCISDKVKHGHDNYCQLCLKQKQKQNKMKKQKIKQQKQQEQRQQYQEIVKVLICNKQLDCRHQCDKSHQLQCPPCRVNISKQFPCGHMQEYECYQSQNQQKCTMILSQKLNCGHIYQYQCSNKPQIYICYSKCNFKLQCGHQCQAQCGQCPQDFHDPCVNKILPLYFKHYCIKENISNVLTQQENIYFHQKYCRIYGIDFEIFSDAYRREVEIEIVIFQMAFKNKIQMFQVQDMMLYTNKLLELVKRKDLYLQLSTQQFKQIKQVLCKLIMSQMKNKIADHVLAQCNQIKFQFEANDVDKILRLFLNLTECIQPQLCSHACSIREFHLTGCSCNQTLNYYRNCGHYIQTQCMSVEVHKIEKYLPACDQICNKQMICGHKCKLKCYQKCICQENTIIKFPGCDHSKQMQCKLVTKAEVCQEQIVIKLKCLHMRQILCFQKDNVQCNQTMEHTCQNCKKKREIMCKDYDNYQCLIQKQCQNCKKVLNGQCDQFFSCICFQKVYEQQQHLVVDKTCYQILDCGHRCAGRLCLPKLHEYCKSKNKCQCGEMKYCNRGLCDKCNDLNPYPVRNLNDQLVKLEKYGLGSLSNLIIKKKYTDFDINNLLIQIQIIIKIHELPQLNNPKFIQVIFFLKNLTQDSELVYKINQKNMEKFQLAVMNLQAYEKQDKKGFINVGKYFNMKKIENNDFQLTRQQLHDL